MNKFAALTKEEIEAAAVHVPAEKDDTGENILPVPADAPSAPTTQHVAEWTYRDAQGRVLFIVRRFEPPGERKQILPLSLWRDALGQMRWCWEGVPAPRPVYNLDKLAANPDAPVVVVEGEKSADSAPRIFPKSIATTSPNGAKAASKADWSPLAGRRVLIWPDADEPGARYAGEVARILDALECEVSIIDALALASMAPDGGEREPAKGYDAADAIAEWSDVGALRKAAVALARPYNAAISEYAPASDGLKVAEPEIDRLAALDLISYDRERAKVADTLGIRKGTLDAAVKRKREDAATEKAAELCQDKEPWPEPVNVTELLDDIDRPPLTGPI